ncbi:hypothetical protein F7725_011638, partial [Dissostichus mawsoni]
MSHLGAPEFDGPVKRGGDEEMREVDGPSGAVAAQTECVSASVAVCVSLQYDTISFGAKSTWVSLDMPSLTAPQSWLPASLPTDLLEGDMGAGTRSESSWPPEEPPASPPRFDSPCRVQNELETEQQPRRKIR